MSIRDSKTQKLLMTVVICGVAAWAYFLSSFVPFGYQARTKKAKELRAQQEALSAELEKARRTVSNLPQLEREQQDLDHKWQQAETLLPTSKEMPELLTQITQSGDQAGVEFKSFKPDASRPQEFYNENPVQIQVKGGFHQVGVFLSRLANMSRIVNVTDLQLDANDQKARQKGDRNAPRNGNSKEDDGERTDHTLTASFTATAYSLRDPNDPEPQAAPAEKGNRNNLKHDPPQRSNTQPVHDSGKHKTPAQGEQ
jgi:type IV pilus assembly protein PilO